MNLAHPIPTRIFSLAISLVSSCTVALATDYTLRPLDIGGGYSISGTIKTDGSTGGLTPSNISDWNITVSQYEDFVFTDATTTNISLGLTMNQGQILVPTSPDGIASGGSMWFYGGTYNQVQVADFEEFNAAGGQSFFAHAGFSAAINLGQPNNSQYVAATQRAGSPDVFDLTPCRLWWRSLNVWNGYCLSYG